MQRQNLQCKTNQKRSSYRFADDFPAVRRNVWRRAHSKFRQSVRTRGHHRLRRNSSHHELFQNRFGGTGTNLDSLRGPDSFQASKRSIASAAKSAFGTVLCRQSFLSFFQNTLPKSSLMFQSIQKRSRFFRHTFWHSCSSRLQAFLNFKTKVCCVPPCK